VNKRLFLLFFLGAIPAAWHPGLAQVKPGTLAPQYQEWLRLTDYIIKEKERDVFLKLTNDRDRDIFIQMFWKIRDPTPATPENEFRDEILKRYQEANKRFHFGGQEGWRTDRGRFWIILGPPSSVVQIAGSMELWPVEIWSYYGDPAKGMPTHFSLVFFQRGNVGEYKLYDPVSDGPNRLLINGKDYSPTDYETMYEEIRDLQPELAAVCLSIIPGEIPYMYQPSPENAIWLANIIESPKKAISESYATHFLNYKGYVTTEYLTNYMESAGMADVVYDPVSGLPFIDFAIAPRNLTLDFYEPKSEYSCSFEVNVSLRAGEKVIYQYTKEFPLTIPQSQLPDTEAMGVSIQDGFPAIPGKYRLSVLLQNRLGKEFSILERDVEVPPSGGTVKIVGPVVGYQLAQARADMRQAYQAGSQRIQVDPKNTLGLSDRVAYVFHILGLTDELWKAGSVRIVLRGAKPNAPSPKTLIIRLSDQPFRPLLTVGQSIPAADLPPDYYDFAATILDGGGRTVAEGRANFVVSPKQTLSHPLTLAKSASQASRFVFDYILAAQFAESGNDEAAGAAYERALAANPSFPGRIPEYAGFLVKTKKYDRALALVERIKDDTRLVYQYRFIRGRALLGLGRYEEALVDLQEANKIYNSDTALLYSLGFAYWKTGRPEDARNVLNAALKLNPDLAEVKALLAEMEKR
jgi:GWxTD domain-containing protein